MSLQQLVIGASGIYISYLTISVISEKLYSEPYPSISHPQQSDKFKFPDLIVWFSSLFCALFGFVKGKISKEAPNPISTKQQMILGILFVLNMLSANYALLFIPYLEQAIGRNCRYLMVVIIGAFFSRVKKGSNLKLPPKKILVAAVITTGVLSFTILSQNKHKKGDYDPNQQWKGYLMLSISIIADALFSDNQAYSKVNFKPSSNHLFTSTSFYSFLFVFLYSVIKGQAVEQINFCIDHPLVMIHILIMSVLQVVGQISIYYVIVNFKQHIFPLISTTRKVFTVLLSIIIFGHSLSAPQWFSIFLVFAGLSYELQEQITSKKQKQSNKKQTKESEQVKSEAKTNQNLPKQE